MRHDYPLWAWFLIGAGLYGLFDLVLWLLHPSWSKSHKLAQILAVTVVTFWYPLRWYPKRVRSFAFWAAWAFMLLAHLSGYLYALWKVGRWPAIMYAVIMPMEWGAMSIVLDRVIKQRPSIARFFAKRQP